MSTEFPPQFHDLLEAQFATLALARPRCSLFILDLANPFRYHDGPDDRRVVVTIEPANVFAVDMNA